MIKATPTDCAYAAGFFDGEGAVMIWRRTCELDARNLPYHRLMVKVSQADRRPLDWLVERFYGTIHFRAAPKGTNERGRWEWTVSSHRAAEFIKAIRPYTVLKSDRIDVALNFQGTMVLNVVPGYRGWKRLTPEVYAAREDLRNQLMWMNRRGAKAQSDPEPVSQSA